MAKVVDGVDHTLYSLLHRHARSKHNKPVVDAVDTLISQSPGPLTADRIQDVAVQAARDAYRREGVRRPSPERVQARAFWGATIASAEHPYTFANDPRGTSKGVHFFASGAISAGVAARLTYLPRGVRHWVGLKVSHVVGVLKECADKVKGTGFNRQDIRTDDAGARAGLRR